MVNIITSDHLPDDILRGESDARHVQRDALAALAAAAPKGATIIYGMRFSTAVG
jgi:hypothetical protein